MLVTISQWFNNDRSGQLSGGGLFSLTHIILIIIALIITITNFLLAKKSSNYAKKVLFICCLLMPIFRLIRMIMEINFKIKTPLEALPFHLCHIMAFVIPLTYFFKFKKAYPCVMFYGFLGGTMTFLFGDYYKYNVLNFYDVESIILHIMLMLVATASYANKDFEFLPNNIYLIPIFLILLCGWASLGNYLFDANYMYLKENGLPFKLVPGHFLFTYLIIAIVIFFFMYLPFIIKYIKKKKTK